MNLVKCPNNHIYNADHYPSCPECANRKTNKDNIDIPDTNQHDINTDTIVRPVESFNLIKDHKPVGWLVCIEGAEYGKEFPLHVGDNTIGRGANMDITLPNDKEISRYIHAKICYDNQKIQYSIDVNQDANAVSINGSTINNSSTILNDRDRIKIGSMTFIFIALCGKDFVWKE